MGKKKFSYSKLILNSTLYTGGSIVGPLVVFLIIGYYLDSKFNTEFPLYVLISLGIAFIVTNILLYKRIKYLTSKIDEEGSKVKKSKKVKK